MVVTVVCVVLFTSPGSVASFLLDCMLHLLQVQAWPLQIAMITTPLRHTG